MLCAVYQCDRPTLEYPSGILGYATLSWFGWLLVLVFWLLVLVVGFGFGFAEEH
jgi:hypothetical protein